MQRQKKLPNKNKISFFLYICGTCKNNFIQFLNAHIWFFFCQNYTPFEQANTFNRARTPAPGRQIVVDHPPKMRLYIKATKTVVFDPSARLCNSDKIYGARFVQAAPTNHSFLLHVLVNIDACTMACSIFLLLIYKTFILNLQQVNVQYEI